MADSKTISRIGYAQVEPNHLSAQNTGEIYAQYPVTDKIKLVEQGMFLKYDGVAGKMNLTGKGEWMLVYSEQKLYDERRQHHKDFALKAEDFVDKKIYPRLFKTNVGDIYTTNAFGAYDATYVEKNVDNKSPLVKQGFVGGSEGVLLTVGDELGVDKTTGYLVKADGANVDANGPKFQVIKVYTMADMQPGVKIQRIA